MVAPPQGRLTKQNTRCGVEYSNLSQAAILLATAAVAAPIARRLRIGTVLGYLAAGVAIGPWGLRLFRDVESILSIAELGIVLLLFLIGLELRPARLWTMRRLIFGAGGVQVAATGLLLGAIAVLAGVPLATALVIGLALAMSSTAFVLQVLEEKKELSARHGRLAFAILLFQDLAAIPLIALVPIIAAKGKTSAADALLGVGMAVGVIAAVILAGRFVINHVYRLVAASGVREAMTASALLTVIGVALLMQAAGLSAALGAFLAGALLADSEYRHQIEADIQPFEGLLLGLFFTAIGMSLDIGLLTREPLLILALVGSLVLVKALILYGIGRWQGLDPASARRLGLAVSQGGEFAFVILGLVVGARLMAEPSADRLAVAVTLSMVTTPLLLLIDDVWRRRRKAALPAFDTPPKAEGHVVIAGFGRVGQIVARILRARGVAFTALDSSPDQIEIVKKFGSTAYYGDASRLDILEAAQTGKARAFVLAIDDVDTSLKTAALVRQHFPDVPIYARARNRQHIYRLADLGVKIMRRETFLSSVDLTRDLLRGLGMPEAEVMRVTDAFIAHDRKRLYGDYQHASNEEKMQVLARQSAAELEAILREDPEAGEVSGGQAKAGALK